MPDPNEDYLGQCGFLLIPKRPKKGVADNDEIKAHGEWADFAFTGARPSAGGVGGR